MANALATLFLNIRARSVDLAQDFRKVERKLTRMGRSFERAGATMTTRFSAPVGLALAAAAREALQFDAAMVDAFSKLPDMTREAAKFGSVMRRDVEKTIADVAQSTSFDLAQVAKAFQNLVQQGFELEKSLSVLPTVAKFSQAAAIDIDTGVRQLTASTTALGGALETAADGFTQVEASPEKFAENVERLGDVLLQISINSPASALELMEAVVTRAGVEGRQTSQSFEDMAAAIGLVAKQGIIGARAGNTIGIVLRDMSLKAGKFKDEWERLGVSVLDSQDNFRPLADVIGELDAKIGHLNPVMQAHQLQQLGITLKSMASMRALLGLSNIFEDLRGKAANAGGTIDKVQAIQMVKLKERLDQLIERFKTVGIVIGNVVIDELVKLGHRVADLVDQFLKLDPSTQRAFVRFTMLAAALGPLTFVFGTFLRLAGSTLSILLKLAPAAFTSQKAFMAAAQAGQIFGGAISSIVATAKTVAVALTTGIGGALTAIMAIFGSLAAVIAAFTVDVSNFSDEWRNRILALRDTFPDFHRGLKVIAQAWSDFAADVARDWKMITELWNTLVDSFVRGANIIKEKLGELRDATAEWRQKISKAAESLPLFGSGIAVVNKLKDKFGEYNKNLEKHEKITKRMGSLRAIGEDSIKSVESMIDAFVILGGDTIKVQKAVEKTTGSFEGFGDSGEEVDKVKDAVKDLNEEWKKFQVDVEQTKLDEKIEEIIDAAKRSGGSFDSIAQALKEAYTKGAELGIPELAKGSDAAAGQIADEVAEKMRLAAKDYGEHLAEEAKKAHQDGVDFWRNAMENAITGVTFDLGDALKQIAIGFAAELATSILGAPGAGSLKDLGGEIAKSIFGDSLKDFGKSLVNSTGSEDGSDSLLVSGIGASLKGVFTDFTAGLTTGVFGDLSGATSSQLGSIAGTLGQYLPVIAAATVAGQQLFSGIKNRDTDLSDFTGFNGGEVIGTLLGDLFGGGLSSDGDSQAGARKSIENWLEDRLREATESGRPFQIFQDGMFQDFGENLIFGDRDRFEDFDLSSINKKFGDEEAGAFFALGNSLQSLLGITEDVGPQIGAILAENLSGNLDNARLLFQTLGIDAQMLEEAMVEVGRAGEESWHSVEVSLQQLNGVIGEGLIGVGDLGGAYDQLLGSAGRGMNAIQSLKNIAIEAGEVGASTLEDLGNALRQHTKLNETEISQLIEAMRNRGVESLDQLLSASDRTLGGIIADLESMGIKWRDSNENILDGIEDIERLDKAWDGIPTDFSTDYTVRVTYEETNSRPPGVEDPPNPKRSFAQGGVFGRGVTPFAKGGVVTGASLFTFGPMRTLGLMGENGAEAIMPLKRMPGGNLGVEAQMPSGGSGVVNINIDARGADSGVESRIMKAVTGLRDDITRFN